MRKLDVCEKNFKDRIRMFIENLAKFNEATWRLGGVVTGDEA